MTDSSHSPSLFECWRAAECPSIKLNNYFEIYENSFGHLKGKNCTFVEVGVLGGGSLSMWRRWLGKNARIIGIDMNPNAKKFEGNGIEIFIGDSADLEFWDSVLPIIGDIDGFLDDGGHTSLSQINAFVALLTKTHCDTIMLIEDTHTSYMREFASHGPHSFVEYSKGLADILAGRTFEVCKGRVPPHDQSSLDYFARLKSVAFFPGIVKLELSKAPLGPVKTLRNHIRETLPEDFRSKTKVGDRVRWPNLAGKKEIFVSSRANPSVKDILSRYERPLRLNLGCGDKILPGYVNIDIVTERAGNLPDICADVTDLAFFPDESVDEILAVHVVEHFWRWQVTDILKEWARILRPGGKMILECPNLEEACREFLSDPVSRAGPGQEGQRSMWVFYGDPRWRDPLMVHRWGYTARSLAKILHQIGLSDIKKEPAQFKLREPRDMRITAVKGH